MVRRPSFRTGYFGDRNRDSCLLREASKKKAPGPESGFRLNRDDFGFKANVFKAEDFPDWKEAVLGFYRKVVGVKRGRLAKPLNLKVLETFPVGDRVAGRKIEYDAFDGLRIPAYLFVPKTDRPVPAVIVYHGHGPGKVNAATPAGAGTNENALALHLAETLGYVVLAPDSRTFGEFKVPGFKSHADYFFDRIIRNQPYMSELALDGLQDMALLADVPEADTKRMGVAGISMGSWRALNHAVLHDEALAAVVAGLYIPWDHLFSEKHCRCQHLPKLKAKLRMEDLAAALFPRKLLVQWGEEDGFFKMGAPELIEATKDIARFLGCPEAFRADVHPGMGHRFSNREIGVFFQETLGAGAWSPARDE